MGTWGTAIFSDDTASDVRDAFRELIGNGLSAPEATARLLAEYRSSLDDQDDGPPFWLGLAVAQWKCGRLQDNVKARALQVIDSDADRRRWAGDARLVRARQVVLDKTRAMLLSAQPLPRRIAKTFRQANDWAIGELVSYRSASGNYVVLRVLGHHVDKGGTAPELDLLDYYDVAPPSPEVAATLGPRPMVEKRTHGYSLTRRFMVGATSAREMPTDRLRRLGVRARAVAPGTGSGVRALLWRTGRSLSLDTFIDRVMPGPVVWRPGPGGDEHLAWAMGDLFACRTTSGRYALFQVVGRHHGDGLDAAPLVVAIDALPESVPALTQVPERALAPHRLSALGFVLVNDGTDAVPSASLVPIGNRPPVAERVGQVFASVPTATAQVERTIDARPRHGA